LTVADAGKDLVMTGASAITITLPAPPGLLDGTKFSIYNAQNPEVTLAAGGGATIDHGGSGYSSLKILPGDTITVVLRQNAYWDTVGGSKAAGNFGIFKAALAGNGYQRLPSGLIMQWGTSGTDAGGNIGVTLPLTFPNAFRNAQVTYNGASAAYFGASIVNNSYMVVTGASPSQTFQWTAIGD
jgi:hypothetical protein